MRKGVPLPTKPDPSKPKEPPKPVATAKPPSSKPTAAPVVDKPTTAKAAPPSSGRTKAPVSTEKRARVEDKWDGPVSAFAALQEEGASEEKLTEVAKQLGQLSKTKASAKRLGRNGDAIRTLLDSIKAKPRFTKLVEYSMDCLANLCVDEVSCEEMADEGAIEVLLEVLKVNPFNETIMRAVNRVVQAMAKNEKLAAMLSEKGVLKAQVFSMNKHLEAPTHASSLKALVQTVQTPQICKAFVSEGGMDALARVAQECKDEPEVMAEVANFGVLITSKDAALAPQIVKLGILDNLLEAVREFPESHGLALHGIKMMLGMLVKDKKMVTYMKERGAMDLVVAAMEAHPDSEELLEIGARVLNIIAGKEDLWDALSKVTGVDFSSSMAVARLGNLALIEDNVDFILQNGGLEALFAAIQIAAKDGSPNAMKVLESAIRAVARLCNTADHVAQTVKCGGIELLLGVLSKYNSNAPIAKECIIALTKMANTEESVAKICTGSGISLTISAVAANPDNDKLAKAALNFIEAVAHFRGRPGQIISAGGIKAIADALEAHPDNEDVAVAAMNAMAALAKDPAALKALADAGLLAKIAELLRKYRLNPELVKAALSILAAAAKDPKLAQLLRDLNVIEDIVKAMECHSANPEIQTIGTAAIAGLASDEQLLQIVDAVIKAAQKTEASSGAAKNKASEALLKQITLLADLSQIPQKAKFLVDHGGLTAASASFAAGQKVTDPKLKPDIIAASVDVLSNLARQDISAISDSALNAILDAALVMTENEEFSEDASHLAADISQDPKRAYAMAKGNMASKLIAIAKNFSGNEKIQTYVMKAVGNMIAQDSASLSAAFKAGGHDLLLDNLLSGKREDAMDALKILARLAFDPDQCDLLLAAGAVDALMRLLKLFPDDPNIQAFGMEILSQFCSTEGVAEELASKGLVPVVLRNCERFVESESVQEGCLHVLDVLSTVDEIAALMVELDVMNPVTVTADAFPQNEEIQNVAAEILDRLGDYLSRMEAKKREEEDVAFRLGRQGGLYDLILGGSRDKDLVIAVAAAIDELFTNAGEDLTKINSLDRALQAIAVILSSGVPLERDQLLRLLRHMGNLAKDPVVAKKLAKAGVALPLQEMLNTHSEDEEVLAEVCNILALLGDNETLMKKFLRDNSLCALFQAVEKAVTVEKFVSYAIFLIANLAVHDSIKNEIDKCRGIAVIAKVMGKWSKSRDIIKHCNICLANCSFDHEKNCSQIVSKGALKSVVQSMSRHDDSPSLLESAAVIISNVCYGNEPNKELCISLGASSGLVNGILKNLANPSLLMSCFRAIGNLAFHLPNIPTIIQDGCVQAIVAGMTYHGSDLDLIQTAVGVMTNLAADTRDENQAIMVQEGAVQAIVEVIQAYTKNSDISSAAISCLCNFALEKFNASMVVRQGGMAGVAKSMTALNYDEQLHESAMRLFFEVSQATVVTDKTIASKGLIPAVIASLKTFSSNSRIVTDGIRGFFHLASSPDTARDLVNLEVVPVLLNFVSKRMKDLVPLKESFRALGTLARSEEGAKEMAVESMELVKISLQIYYADTKFCELVLGFIGNVCCYDSAADLVGTTDIIPTIISTMKAKRDDKEVTLRGLRALENMGYSSDENRNKLKKAGALIAIDTTRKVWGRDSEVEKACQAASDAIYLKKVRTQEDLFTNIRKRLDDAKEHDPSKGLTQATKNMLLAGAIFIKHSTNAAPKSKHVYLTKDLKKLGWKDPKKGADDTKFMKIDSIKIISRGLCTPQLKRTTAFGKPLASEELAFALFSKDKSLSFEAGSKNEREEWMEALSTLRELHHASLQSKKAY